MASTAFSATGGAGCSALMAARATSLGVGRAHSHTAAPPGPALQNISFGYMGNDRAR